MNTTQAEFDAGAFWQRIRKEQDPGKMQQALTDLEGIKKEINVSFEEGVKITGCMLFLTDRIRKVKNGLPLQDNF